MPTLRTKANPKMSVLLRGFINAMPVVGRATSCDPSHAYSCRTPLER
jgi:hypothetical protein